VKAFLYDVAKGVAVAVTVGAIVYTGRALIEAKRASDARRIER
jgi:hypothetical protein